MQVYLVGDRPGDEHGHRHDSFRRGATAVITGFQRPVPQVLVDREHGLALVHQDSSPGDQHLPVSSGLDRSPGPAAGNHAVRPLRALAAFHDVTMIGGQYYDPAGMTGPVEQRSEVLHGVGTPVGAAGIGAVQSIIDRVQHAGDQRLADHVSDSGGDIVSHGIPKPG